MVAKNVCSSDICGHNYCEDYISLIKREGEEEFTCPHVECENTSIVKLTKIKRNKAMDRAIKKLHYYCPNRQAGCKESPSFGGIAKHLNDDCQYSLVPCSKCKKTVYRKDLAAHEETCMSQACPYEDIGCDEVWQVEGRGRRRHSQTEHHTGQHMALLIHRLRLEKDKRVVRPKDIRDKLDQSERQISSEIRVRHESDTALLSFISTHLFLSNYFSTYNSKLSQH